MEWKEVKIGDLGQIITGKTPKTAIRENWGGKIPFLSPSDDMSNKTSPVTARTLTELGVAEVAKCLIPANSICVSCIGSDLGKVVKTDRELVTNQQINTIVPHSNIDSDFVYYLMCIVGKELNYISKTSTAVPIINKSTFSDWDIVIPRETEDQRRIASILSSLDRKIELNNKINADLEEMAQAIFKNWFVDFEPFKNGKFVDSELGMIPEGWKVGTLFDIAEIFDKKRKPLSGNVREKMDKIYPYYGATSCMDYVDDYIFDGIYTLIGEDGSVVKENGLPYMQYVWGKMWVNNHAHILQGKNGYSTEMIHALLSITNIKFLVTGAVQAKLSQGNMQKILVAIPPKNVLDEIRPVIDNLYSKIRINTDENSRLSLLRDTLLPRLMSGELEIPE